MAFMRPTATYFTQHEAAEYTRTECDDREPEDFSAGWYGRLSAPGYMDCTDWDGPYSCEAEALHAVMETFECDENGDDLPIFSEVN